MTNVSLAASYLLKAETRLKVLALLQQEAAYSDVVREAQEVVELALKGMLRQVGVEPPKWHDVGEILREYRQRLPAPVQLEVDRLAQNSAWLQQQRELAFYGDESFIPTEEFSVTDAVRAIDAAHHAAKMTRWVIFPQT